MRTSLSFAARQLSFSKIKSSAPCSSAERSYQSKLADLNSLLIARRAAFASPALSFPKCASSFCSLGRMVLSASRLLMTRASTGLLACTVNSSRTTRGQEDLERMCVRCSVTRRFRACLRAIRRKARASACSDGDIGPQVGPRFSGCLRSSS